MVFGSVFRCGVRLFRGMSVGWGFGDVGITWWMGGGSLCWVGYGQGVGWLGMRRGGFLCEFVLARL